MWSPLDIDTLSTALCITYDNQLSDGQCKEMAWNILSFFGYGNRVLSNRLDSGELALFYELEDRGLIRTEIRLEQILSRKAYSWRVVEFVLLEDRIEKVIAQAATSPHVDTADDFNIYSSLPPEAFRNCDNDIEVPLETSE